MPISITPREAKKDEVCEGCKGKLLPLGPKVVNAGIADVFECVNCGLQAAFFPSQDEKNLTKPRVLKPQLAGCR